MIVTIILLHIILIIIKVTSLDEQSWSSRHSAHRDPSLHLFLFPSTSGFFSTMKKFKKNISRSQTVRILTSNVAKGVRHWVAFTRQSVRPLPGSKKKLHHKSVKSCDAAYEFLQPCFPDPPPPPHYQTLSIILNSSLFYDDYSHCGSPAASGKYE